MKRNEIELTEVLCSKIREWLLQMFESATWKYEDYLSKLEEPPLECQELDSMEAYAYYFENTTLSKEEYASIFEVILNRFLTGYSPREMRMQMASSYEVLVDDNASNLWLAPFAKAERTSIAYERGIRLADAEKYDLARAIMQKAADEGDEHCCMYLIKNKISQNVLERNSSSRNNEIEVRKLKSIPFAKAMILISMRKFNKAEAIMREAADCGDVDCAMYLMRQKLAWQAKTVCNEEEDGGVDYEF